MNKRMENWSGYSMVYLQPVLQLDDGTIQDGGRQTWRDSNCRSHSLISRWCNSLDLLLVDLMCVNFPVALSKEASLLIQYDFGLHWAAWEVADLNCDLDRLTWRTVTITYLHFTTYMQISLISSQSNTKVCFITKTQGRDSSRNSLPGWISVHLYQQWPLLNILLHPAVI